MKTEEDAAALYLQTGLILDLPVIPADEGLAGLNREVRLLNQILPVEGVAYGEPWTYRVPTSLLVLDDGTHNALPVIATDVWTGKPVLEIGAPRME